MIVDLQFPDLKGYAKGHGRYWMSLMLFGRRDGTYQIQAIITTFIRLVEAAYSRYQLARQHTEELWATHDRIAIGSHFRAVAYFEDCITLMHRATLCMKRLRGYREVPSEIRDLFKTKPSFVAENVAKKLMRIRNAIQHMDDFVLTKRIQAGTPFMLTVTGPEIAVPDSDQPHQTKKTYDRLVIGDEEVLLSDLVAWLEEMGNCANTIAEYEPQAAARSQQST